MSTRGFKRAGFVVAVCALAGALAGIAGSAAAPSKRSSPGASAARTYGYMSAHRFRARRAFKRAMRFGLLGGPPGGPPVHAEAVVPNASGSGFDTVTMDAGKLKSADGSKLTLTEGTPKATYGTPTIDVGSDPTVIRDRKKASLGDLQQGDDVRIIQAPKGTVVMAEDAAFEAQEQKDGPHWGPPQGGGFGPPGGPGAPGGYPGGQNG
jgi:hypothetical protein